MERLRAVGGRPVGAVLDMVPKRGGPGYYTQYGAYRGETYPVYQPAETPTPVNAAQTGTTWADKAFGGEPA